MADIDIDSVTRMLGRDQDQEINGLHYEAVDRAAKAAELSLEEVGKLAASPQVREALDEWSTTADSWERAHNRYLDILWDTTDYEELDHRDHMSSIAYDRVMDSQSRMDEVAAEATGNPDAGERLRSFIREGEPLIEQAGSQELRGMLHLNHALEVGQEQAEARLPRGQAPSAELRTEGEEHLAAARQALAQRPDADGVLAIVQDLAAHPHSLEWHGNDDMDTPIYRELGQAIEATGLGDKETLSRLQQQRTFNANFFHINGYTPGKPLPLEAPQAPVATKDPEVSVGRDMSPSVAAERGTAVADIDVDSAKSFFGHEGARVTDTHYRNMLAVSAASVGMKVDDLHRLMSSPDVRTSMEEIRAADTYRREVNDRYSRLLRTGSPAEVAEARTVFKKAADLRTGAHERLAAATRSTTGDLAAPARLYELEQKLAGRVGRSVKGTWEQVDRAWRLAPQVGQPSVPSPGGAPRVGGHAQGHHGHDQQRSVGPSL